MLLTRSLTHVLLLHLLLHLGSFRRNFTNALGTSTATYVWLPLFINPTTKHAKVIWRDEWRLDDEGIYPWPALL